MSGRGTLDSSNLEAQLGKRLKSFRENHGYSQNDLANMLGYANRSTISRWENNKDLPKIEVLTQLSKLYKCNLDDLIGNPEINEKASDEWLTFLERTPASNLITDGSQLEIEHGIVILRAIIEGKTLEELCELPGIPKYHRERNDIFALLRTVLISGEIMITKIPFAKSLEEQLKEKYPQLRGAVHVVDLSRTSISEALPPELVAWAAAHHIIPLLRQPLRVGFGFGYTLHRMCRLVPPSVNQFRGTHWIPLMAFAGDEDSVATSANHHAALMEQRHYYSEAIHLPYVPPEKHTSHEGLEKIRRHWEQLNVALVSAYGWNKSTKPRVALSYPTNLWTTGTN